jgi:hypothetical protein
MNTITLVSPALDAGRARAPDLAAALLARLRRGGRAVWRGLEAHGRVRALREFRDQHDRWASRDPNLAQRLRAASAFLVAEGERRGD